MKITAENKAKARFKIIGNNFRLKLSTLIKITKKYEKSILT